MTTVAPSAQPLPPSTPQALSGPVTATLVSSQANLEDLAPGTLLRGQVTASTDGSLEIATALGRLEVALRLSIPPQTPVLLQLGGPAGTVILLPDRPDPEIPKPAPAPASDNPQAPLRGEAPPSSLPATRDSIERQAAIPAQVLAAARPSAAPAAAPLENILIPGARIALRVVAVLPSEGNPPPGAGLPAKPAPGPAANPPAPPGTVPNGPPRSGPTGSAPVSGPFAHRPEARLETRPEVRPSAQAASRPNATSAPAGTTQPLQGSAPPANGQTANPGPAVIRGEGKVTGVTGDGRAVIATTQGTVALERPTSLLPGQRLLVDLILPGLAGPGPKASLPALSILAHGSGWPALTQALDLAGTDPAASGVAGAGPLTSASLADLLPSPGPRLTSNLLFFLSALSGGSLAAWLGEANLERLERLGRSDLLARLGQDFGQLGRLAETAADDWRLFALPVLHENQITPVHLYLRRDRAQGEADDQDDQTTRFLVELSLSRLGELQLDGLVQGKQFDLILRSRRPLSPAMRKDIAEIFESANEITGASGHLAFQASADWAFQAASLWDGGGGPDLFI